MAKAFPVLGVDPEDTLLSNAALIVPVRIAELVAWERYIDDPTNVIELHEMRIAAKRLRYTLEIFAPCLNGALATSISVIKVMQDHLGTIHDADVMIPELEIHLRKLLKEPKKGAFHHVTGGSNLDDASGLIALCRKQRDERDARYAAFLELWKRSRHEGFFENMRMIMRLAAVEEERNRIWPLLPEQAQTALTGEENVPRKRVRNAKPDHRIAAGSTSRNGNHPSKDASESGVDQHSLFEDGNSG